MYLCQNNWAPKAPFLFLLILLLLASCQEAPVKEKPIEPNKFINGYTSGQISAASPVTIVLNLPENFAHISDQEPPKNIFKLKPEVQGKTYWGDQQTLLFEPNEPLRSGTKYEARVDLKKLLGIEDGKNEIFTFFFDVIPLSFDIKIDNLQAYEIANPKWNFLELRLYASDVVEDKSLLDGFLTAKQENRRLGIQISNTSATNTYTFTIDSIERLTEESSIEIVWKGKGEISGLKRAKGTHFNIPALDHFKFNRVKVIDDPDQHVKLEFSDPVDQDQELDGLISFTDNTAFTLRIENNNVLLYPKSHLSGDKTIKINKKIRTQKGNHLQADITQNIHFGQIKPEVRFTSKGTVLPGKSDWNIPFEAVNLTAVDVFVTQIFSNNIQQFLQSSNLSGSSYLERVGQLIHHEKINLKALEETEAWEWVPYALDLVHMIERDPGAIYRVELRFKKEYARYNCEESELVTEETEDQQNEERYYTGKYYYPNNYIWYERDNPCSISYYNSSRFVQKNMLASNIGLTVKEDGENLIVYANDLQNTLPMSGVKISLMNYQQQELAHAKTNKEGHASIHFEGVPYLVVAEKDGEFAYLRVDGGSSLSYSKFDTKGVNIEKGIKGFIYGERGVWRPGDTLFLTVIVDDHENPLPEGHPVVLKLSDPRGNKVAKITSINGLNGFYAFKIPTDDDAITGFWKARAEVGGAHFEKTIRIETIKPNRLKVELSFNKDMLSPTNNKGTIKSRWLHGGIASQLKADINITIRPTKTSFEKYETYNFDDPSRIFPVEQLSLFEGQLDNKGLANFNFNLPSSQYAPGMLNVSIASKVYEQGGDFSIDQTSIKYAPFDRFIGIRGPGEDQAYQRLDVDETHKFEVVALSKDGKIAAIDGLEFAVYKLDWSWWYGSNAQNLASYISNDYARKIASGLINTKDGKGNFKFQIDYPDWGWYYVQVKQASGGHQTGMKIYLDWPSSYSRENRKTPGSANLLSLTSDKEKYNIGEEVKVSVPTPSNGRLLITLEKGNKQLKSWQLEANEKETTIRFKATPEMTPNVYLSVAVIQSHAQTINDLPIRMYGVKPIMIEDEQTVLHPVLDLPETIRPNENYEIQVSEENGKSMTYTFAVVDDGLLDLTKFKTPDPHNHFYAKEALAVKTWDIYNDVMGAFGKRLEKVFAIGGDMEMERGSDKKKANRFKAVVTFLGPFQLEKGESNTHQIKMPNYVGSVRCMVVAGNDNAYGHAQKTVPVKQPLMVLATMPRILSPGEQFKLPVSLFVMDEKINKVNIEIETNSFFEHKNSKQNLSISDVGEHMSYFDIQVADKQGIGKVKIKVTSGNESASYEIEVQVRNPNSRAYNVTYHALKPGEKWVISPELIGTAGTNEVNLSVSGIPPLNLERRLKYLIRYPYGCVEQTTSSVFPQLYLDKLLDLQQDEQRQIEHNIKSGIQKLAGFQLANGGFSYWRGNRSIATWGTSYAGHFLLLARETGYHVPLSMINSWINYQTQASKNWRYNKYTAIEQAYCLYTLALAGKPNLSAMNRLRETDKLHPTVHYLLAATYSIVGQQEVAAKLINSIEYPDGKDREYWRYNYGSATRDKALRLQTYLLMDETDKAIPLVKQISEELKSNRWMSTQTTAFALYSVALIVEKNKQEKELGFKYIWNKEDSRTIQNETPIFSADLDVHIVNKLQIENISKGTLFVSLTNSGIPVIGQPVAENKNLQLELKYFDMDGNPLDITSLPQGTDFYASATISNPGKYGYYLDNVALSQLFPSGWEIINTRMLDLGADLKSDQSDYIDYRDDRVNTFFNLRAGKSKRFIVLLNAAYQGKYYLPITKCGAMYNNDVNAHSGGGWITVVD